MNRQKEAEDQLALEIEKTAGIDLEALMIELEDLKRENMKLFELCNDVYIPKKGDQNDAILADYINRR